MNTYKISTFEFALAVAVFLLGTSVIIIPVLGYSEQDMWVAGIIGVASGVGYAFFLSLCKVQGHHPLARIILSIYSLHLASLVTGNISDILTQSALPDTPGMVINIVMVLIAAYAVFLGIETIFRLAGLFLTVSFVVGVLLIIMSASEMDFQHLQPILNHSPGVIIKDAIPIISFPFFELVVFLPILKMVQNRRKALVGGVLLGGTLIFLIILLIVLVLPPGHIKNIYSPTFVVIKSIPSGYMMEAVTVVVWVQTTFFKLAVLHYIESSQLGEAFNLDYQKIVLPISVLIIGLSNSGLDNSVEKFLFVFKIYPLYAIPIQIGIPLSLLIANRISNAKVK